MSLMKVDYRKIKAPGDTTRLRFCDVHEDQLDLILQALELAGDAMGTEHGTVALESICLHFLTTFTNEFAHAPQAAESQPPFDKRQQ